MLNKDELPAVLNNPALKKALNVLDIMSFDEEEREAYEGHLKWLRIEANTLKKYEAKGFTKGEKLGIKKGKREGKIEGKMEVADNMLKQGFKVEDIQKVTGLSKQQVLSLKKSPRH